MAEVDDDSGIMQIKLLWRMFKKKCVFSRIFVILPALGLLLVVQIMVEETVHLNNVENFEDLLQLMNIGEGCCCMQRIGKP